MIFQVKEDTFITIVQQFVFREIQVSEIGNCRSNSRCSSTNGSDNLERTLSFRLIYYEFSEIDCKPNAHSTAFLSHKSLLPFIINGRFAIALNINNRDARGWRVPGE